MPSDNEVLDNLLVRFVQRDPDASRQFLRMASPLIKGVARRHAPDLPADVLDEVVSETCLILLDPSAAPFDPARGSTHSFVIGKALNAVKKVRASYCPPGTPTRPRQRGEAPSTHVPLHETNMRFDESIHTGDRRILPDVRQVEAQIHLSALLKNTSAVLVAAITAAHIHGKKKEEVARKLGLSRFQIQRAFRQLQDRATA